MSSNTIIVVPAWISLLLLGILLALVFGLPVMVFGKRQQPNAAAPPGWLIPNIDDHAQKSSFFHTWDPRFKIATLLAFCFLVVTLNHPATCILALFTALLAVYYCGTPWQRVRRRLTPMAGFLSMFLVVLPFTAADRPNETLLLFSPLQEIFFHTAGLLLAILIILKACTVALLMEPMLGTAPLNVTLQALTRMGLPKTISQMILLCHRYLFVFLQEALRMQRSMRVRGFTARTNLATLRSMGNFFGMLFIRSFDRTQRVFDAMLCRGYQGTFPVHSRFTPDSADLKKTWLWVALGLSLVLLDRLGPLS
ncbi:MAG: cobalt ECF transporter T component CbiQ [Deltaproteobacteria bacterium]|nr:MAG: cobalt ECF transporter T component CbiQ [Deltaproteobacteria bacterium]